MREHTGEAAPHKEKYPVWSYKHPHWWDPTHVCAEECLLIPGLTPEQQRIARSK